MTNDQSLLNQCLQLGTGEADCELPELEKLLALALDVLVDGDFPDRWEVAKVFPKLGAKAIALREWEI